MQYTKKYTYKEELANAVSHFIGALLAIAGLIVMVHYSVARGNQWHIISSSVFGASMIITYFSSTLTHILPPGRNKDFFFNFDRIAIYLLIAGTYTPISLVTLQGPFGWVIFGLEWGMAVAGILMIIVKPGDFDSGVNLFYVLSYAAMGWLILIAMVPVIRSLPFVGWIWIYIGGFFYSIGILFYTRGKFRYHHLVWHILVICGTASHFIFVFYYVIPR